VLRLLRFFRREPFARWFVAGFALLFPWVWSIAAVAAHPSGLPGASTMPAKLVHLSEFQFALVNQRWCYCGVGVCFISGICVLAGTLVVFIVDRWKCRTEP
jgi:hypothetical protein